MCKRDKGNRDPISFSKPLEKVFSFFFEAKPLEKVKDCFAERHSY